jgi:hypothetical protein
MKKFLVFLSALIVFGLVYYLLFYTVTYKTKDTHNPPNSFAYQYSEYRKVKLSIKQIDSLTSFENYKFTVMNYYKDVIPVKI